MILRLNKLAVGFFITVLSFFTGAVSAADAKKNYSFNLPASLTSEALATVAEQTGHNLFYPADKLAGLESSAISGEYTLKQVLTLLLADSDIIAKISKQGVIILRDKATIDKIMAEKATRRGFWASLLSAKKDAEQLARKAEERRLQKALKEQIEIISIAGFRESLSNALSYKKYSDNQIDVISADDIGQLPDVEIGDVLERIAGVQVNRGSDGVVNGTSIRGLPGYFNRTLYNGRVISTSLSTERYFDSQVIPAAFVSRVEVHKTAVSDVIEGGLAGVINLKSIRAFDVGKDAFRLKHTTSVTSNANDLNSDLLAIYSSLNTEQTIGFSAGLNYLQGSNENQQSKISEPSFKLTEGPGKDYNGDGNVENGDVLYLPNTVTYSLDKNERERTAVFANIDWRPDDNFNLFAEVLYSGYDTLGNDSQLRLKPRAANQSEGDGAITASYQGGLFEDGPQDYLMVYHPTNLDADFTNQYNLRESDTTVAFVEAKWLVNGWTLSLGSNLSKSKTTQFQMEAKQQAARRYFDVTLGGNSISEPWQAIFHNPIDEPDYTEQGLLNSDTFRTLTVNGQQLDAQYESNSWGVDLDADYEFDVYNLVLSPSRFKVGLHYTEDESLANRPHANFGRNTELLFNDNELSYLLVEPEKGQWFNQGSGYAGTPPQWLVPDMNNMIATKQWTAEDISQIAQENGDFFEPGIRNDLKENIFAAYMRLDFDSQESDFSGNVGLRYVYTKHFASGQGSDIDKGLVDYGLGDDPFAEDYQADIKLPLNDYFTKEHSYEELLPSLNLRYHFHPEALIRLAWSKTMTRPLRQDLRVLDEFEPAVVEDAEVVANGVITSADPELAPFIANNVDISAEWYFDDESAVSLALYHKDLITLVTPIQYTQQLPLFHQQTSQQLDDQTVTMNEKVNRSGANLKGATLSFQQPFTYLPSFLSQTGVKATYSYIDNSRPDLLRNISKNNASVVLYFQSDKFDAHLSYTYRSERVKELPTPEVPTLYISPSNMLKASVSYKATEYIDINFAVSNLADQAIEEYYDNGMNREVSDYGRTLSMTLTAKM